MPDIEFPPFPAAPDLREIKKPGEQAATLTKQLLAFSRKQLIQPRTLNINDIFLKIEKMIRRIIGEDIEFTLDLGSEVGLIKVISFASLKGSETILVVED